MAIIVKKFGGSSVSSIPKLKNIAKQILLEKEKMLTCCFLWSALIAFWTIIYSLSFFRRYTMDELKEGRTFIYICLLSQLI
jgi:hypothetical protein